MIIFFFGAGWEIFPATKKNCPFCDFTRFFAIFFATFAPKICDFTLKVLATLEETNLMVGGGRKVGGGEKQWIVQKEK